MQAGAVVSRLPVDEQGAALLIDGLVTSIHVAVVWGVPQLKFGSFTRSERMAK
jgi:hypothetical protein